MATNRIRIDLNSNNNNIVGLVLCVLSEICTAELAKDLHLDVLKVIFQPLSALVTVRPISERKLSSHRSKSLSGSPNISLSSWPKSPVASKKRVMEFCSAAWLSWKVSSSQMSPIPLSWSTSFPKLVEPTA